MDNKNIQTSLRATAHDHLIIERPSGDNAQVHTVSSPSDIHQNPGQVVMSKGGEALAMIGRACTTGGPLEVLERGIKATIVGIGVAIGVPLGLAVGVVLGVVFPCVACKANRTAKEGAVMGVSVGLSFGASLVHGFTFIAKGIELSDEASRSAYTKEFYKGLEKLNNSLSWMPTRLGMMMYNHRDYVKDKQGNKCAVVCRLEEGTYLVERESENDVCFMDREGNTYPQENASNGSQLVYKVGGETRAFAWNDRAPALQHHAPTFKEAITRFMLVMQTDYENVKGDYVHNPVIRREPQS
ncbi:MAG: hypothetical protein FJZ58_04400 [Chlamydiae bacterium]|nr:hypothetical protein [Chlamydiota bacterium]